MQCTKPVRITKNLDPCVYPEGLLVPCGKCLACRIAKRREWSMRILHEMDSHEKASFVTLTYSDEHIPPNASLDKAELQKFFKRLRKNAKKVYELLGKEVQKIRYFACGEYGDQTERPHYHIILFGLGLTEIDKSIVMDSWSYADWSVSTIRDKSFGLVELDSIRYVAQYIDKKLSGEEAEKEYDRRGREPVFRLLSLGLGSNYIDRNAEQVEASQKITIQGIPQTIPRYYINRQGLSLRERKEQALTKERELIKKLTGHYITLDDAYTVLAVDDYLKIEAELKKLRKQKDRNLKAKASLKQNSKL